MKTYKLSFIRKLPLGRTAENTILSCLEFFGIQPMAKLYDGSDLYVHSNESVSRKLIGNQIFEEETTKILQREISENDFIVDIGANIGYYSILFSNWSNNEVVAFEPESLNFKLLEKNRKLNKANNLKTHKKAVLDREKKVNLSINKNNRGNNRVSEKKSQKDKETVKAIKLDDCKLQPDFIKIDAEGSEPKIIKGMQDTLEEHKPNLLMEYYKKLWPSEHNTFEILQEIGYTPLIVQKNGTLLEAKYRSIPVIQTWQNILFTTKPEKIDTKIESQKNNKT